MLEIGGYSLWDAFRVMDVISQGLNTGLLNSEVKESEFSK